jgi:hypothetical protein
MELAAKDLEISNELIIIRVTQNAYQTNGGFMIFDKQHSCVFKGKTLELPFLANQKQISSIPLGTYICEKMVHQTFGKCFQVYNVPNRSGIFIHVGNYHNQIRGCILLGSALIDINADGIVDVVNSRRTLDKAYSLLTKKFNLVIL